jgi:hypothetical protein
MLKNVIAPIQAWLLSQGRCVADGQPLEKGKKEKWREGLYKVTHSCGRVFIYDPKTNSYRRALQSEINSQ